MLGRLAVAVPVVILISLFASVSVFLYTRSDQTAPAPIIFTATPRHVQRAAERCMLDHLLTPSQAKFQPPQITPMVENYSWKIQGTVDSQNVFGAMLRQPYKVIVWLQCQNADNPQCWNCTTPQIGATTH
jgi:hypothetical protein